MLPFLSTHVVFFIIDALHIGSLTAQCDAERARLAHVNPRDADLFPQDELLHDDERLLDERHYERGALVADGGGLRDDAVYRDALDLHVLSHGRGFYDLMTCLDPLRDPDAVSLLRAFRDRDALLVERHYDFGTLVRTSCV
jgi:hypothetical protein